MAKAKKKTKAVKPKAKSKGKVKVVKAKTKPKAKKSAKKSAVTKAKASKSVKKSTLKKQERDWQIYLAPLYDKVLLRKFADENTTASGLYIPGVNDQGPMKAEVLAVGKGLLQKKGRIRPLDVQVGDSIVYSPYAGTSITVDGNDLLIVKEEEILGIVE